MNVHFLKQRGARYWQVARWIVVDSLWRYRRRLTVLLGMSGLALALQAGALSGLLVYARALEVDRTFELWGVALEARTSFSLLVGALALTAAMFVAASFLRLYSERGFFDLGRRYGLFCSGRLVSLASQALHGTMWKKNLVNQAEVERLLSQGGTTCARVVHRMASALPALAGLLIFAGFLLYLDVTLTAIAVTVMLLSFYFFYRLSVHAANVMREREILNKEAAGARRSLIEAIGHRVRPIKPDDRLIADEISDGAVAKSLATLLRFQAINVESTHINIIAQAIVIVLIGLIKGKEIITTGTGFGELVIFIAAGRMAMGYFLGVTNALVLINRFYPMVADYVVLIDRLIPAARTAATAETLSGRRTFVIAAPPLANPTPERPPHIGPGARLALVAPRAPNRLSVPGVVSALRIAKERKPGTRNGRHIPPGLCWLVPAKSLRNSSLNTTFGLPLETNGLTLRRDLAAMGVPPDSIDTLPSDPSAELDEADWGTIAPAALWGASLLAAGRAPHPIIVVGESALAALGKAGAEKFFSTLAADRITIIAYDVAGATRTGKFGERHALLYDGTSVVGYVGVDELHADPTLLALVKEPSADIAIDDVVDDEA